MSGPLDALPDAVLVVDARRRVVDVNEAAVALLGHSREALIGGELGTVLSPRGRDGAPLWNDGWPRAARLPGVHRIPEHTVDVRRFDGTDVSVAVTGRYRRSADGAIEGVVLSLRPTERRERESASGIEVVSTVSHELRSPLTSVKGFTALLLNRWERLKDEQKREMLEQVHVDADRVTRLVTELLDISRLETGRLKLRCQMIALGPLVTKAVADVQNLHPDLEPEVRVPENLPDVYADPDKIMQVLTNLVENTGKYANARGVVVEAVEVPDGAEGKGMVKVEVRDEGPGIPARDLPKVFTKFFRSGEGRPTGSGLGLYIARGIVEAHGGEMTVESAVGEGATFAFTLPAGIPEELEVDRPTTRESDQ